MPQTVFVTGFMGSGKSTFGKQLANKLKMEFVDLDEAIATMYEAPNVKTLIEQKGFEFFRVAENETLKSLNATGKVVSAGGGTPCYFDNMPWMKQNGTVVYLEMDEKTLFNRLKQGDMNERPLLKGLDTAGLQKFIHEKLAERLPYYKQAHITFNPLKQKIDELALQLESIS